MKIDRRIALSCLAALIAQSGITLYLPSLPSIAEHFQAAASFSALTLSAFLVGMGLSMLLWGKVAAVLGSRTTLIGALGLFAVGSSGVALSIDTSMFLTCRVIQGVAAGGISIMARVLLRDSFSIEQLPKALSWLSICFVLSLGVAQFAGALLYVALGWQAIFVTSAALSVLVIIPIKLYGPVTSRKPLALTPSRSAYKTLIQDSRFLRPVLAGGLGYGVIILFGASTPAIFSSISNGLFWNMAGLDGLSAVPTFWALYPSVG